MTDPKIEAARAAGIPEENLESVARLLKGDTPEELAADVAHIFRHPYTQPAVEPSRDPLAGRVIDYLTDCINR